MIIQNIEKKIKLSLIISVTSIIGGIVLSIVGFAYGYQYAKNASNQIYVTTGETTVIANRIDKNEALEIEASNMVKTFHSKFFTLPPDDKFIKQTIEESLYLIDESGMRQRNALAEKGFYMDIMSQSANFSIICDSVTIDKQNLTFVYYGRQLIDKKNQRSMRELITSGGIREIPRTQNNPYGYIIINFKTISNKDI